MISIGFFINSSITSITIARSFQGLIICIRAAGEANYITICTN
jgi:hypothetical protein